MDSAFEVGEDALLDGRLRLLQPRRGHRAGTDAVLLAAAASVRPGERIADFGAGTGAVGLALAAREPSARVILIERDPDLAELCRRNLALNGAEGRGEVLCLDLLAGRAAREGAGLAGLDLVVTNPPFVEAGEAPRSPERLRANAHELPPGGFRRWLEAAADALRHRGRLGMIQRADRLVTSLDGLRPAFGGFTLRPVHPRADAPAIRVLVGAVRAGRAAPVLLPPLVLHGADGRFTPEAEALHRGGLLDDGASAGT
ncbi:tRNA1(Val) (adenine(37)-N6)-methyltransferase [Salinarimonas soli]|uniref:Methyltransferase n=1 Tax=Salinarimonas soli TaxID=1638099 RepID=A0A5B2V5Y2_9HYPH|nr:methyltransferase [Salinarimonas soli]KAA2234371.1 methyltransferase [Salinarimonas soli]